MLKLFGFVFLLLGAIGVVVPLLPTVPFVILSAWCFARSSPALHDWLVRNKTFGPMIRQWESGRCISMRVKCIALLMIVGVGGCSVMFAMPPGWPQWTGGAVIAIGLIIVARLKVCDSVRAGDLETNADHHEHHHRQ